MRLTRSLQLAMFHIAVGWSCVHPDAGFTDTNRLVRERTGADPAIAASGRADDGAIAHDALAILARPLTADGALRVAVLNNRDVRVAYESLGISAADVFGASMLPNPTGGFAYRFPVGNAASMGLPAFWDIDGTIDVRAMLLLPARRGAARAAFEAARLDVAARTLAVGFDAMRAFYEYQASTLLREMRETISQTMAASFEAARALREAGNITALDAAQQEALAQESRMALVGAEAEAASARERLVAALGLFGADTQFDIETRLAEVPTENLSTDALESRVVERSMVLASLRHRIAADHARVGLARAAGLLPQLDVGVSIAQEEGHQFVGPEVRVALPLLNQGQGEIAAHAAEARRDEAQPVATAVRLRAAVRNTAVQLSAARSRANWYRDVQLPIEQRIVEASQLQANAMQLGVFQLLAARRAQIEAGAEYVQALRSYWLARTELARLLAGGAPTELRAHAMADERTTGDTAP